MTAQEAQKRGRARIEAAFSAAAHAGGYAARDAELLLMHALSLGRAALMSRPERELTAEESARYDVLIAERTMGRPIQYIVGEQEFYGLRFRLTPDVLIPRPETEHLVEAVLNAVRQDEAVRIVDVGTGSGAIAVTLAKLLPRAVVYALDVSEEALRIAQRNAEENGVGERVQFLHSDLLEAVAGERFDVVVSNPPYVPLGERESLDTQVSAFEPVLALFAGETGFEVYERLIPQSASVLCKGGLLAMEIGWGQSAHIAELLRGWSDVRFVEDLQGITRVALARRA